MSKYLKFSIETNQLIARFDSSINSSIPTESIMVSDDAFYKTINEQDGVWTLVGGQVLKMPFPEPTPAELAAIALQEQDQAAKQATKADVVIQYLINHTPAECADYVQANVTNLAQAKDMLAKFAMALSVLAKGNLRD